MISEEFLERHFYSRFYDLNYETILEINSRRVDGSLNNVVVGLEDHCYGVELINEVHPILIQVFYINGNKGLSGDLLQLNIFEKERDTVLLIFCNVLSEKYGIDILDTFNIFQNTIRTICEQIGYFTIGANEFQKYKGKNASLIVRDTKGIIVLPFLLHLDLFKFLFGDVAINKTSPDDSFVYLMFNKRNNFIKIGKSVNPRLRERTLQAEEPEIVMIATWKADKVHERILHQKYKSKRKRGEWFELSFKEMKDIRKYMDENVD